MSLTMESGVHPPELRAAAKALSRQRRAVAQCLFETLAEVAKWSDEVETLGAEQFLRLEIGPPVDYLINYLSTGDAAWRSMYLGHLIEQIHRPGEDPSTVIALRRQVLDLQRQGLARLLAGLIDEKQAVVFDRHLLEMQEIVTIRAAGAVDVRVLFVGDCLYENIVAFMTIPLIEQGVALRHEYATSKNPIELRNGLRKLAGAKFDLVCFSPYSNEFSPALLETFYNTNPLLSRRKLVQLAADAHQQTQATLRLIVELFDCGVYVQNTNNIRRHDGGLLSMVKNLLTRRPRGVAAAEVNGLLDQLISDINQERHTPLVMVDERLLRQRFGEMALGKLYYAGEKHHPSVMAEKLSRPYRDLIMANSLLLGKKVVVTDLDDTLWKGAIGEGAVEHHSDRQLVLRALRLKGVLLAVASRNDRETVHWTGGVLQSTDFVTEQINWDPKPTSIMRIAETLNLKLKDFVFIDDRADQRELVQSAIPEIEVLDATADDTWDRLAWWAASLPEQVEGDRTQLYLERKQRESFISLEAEAFDQDVLFAGLGLKVEFHFAAGKALPRVAELINRTNQFNTCASRASPQQVAAWSQSPKHLVLVANAKDKFGDMGLVSVMVLDLENDALGIRAWVLSCRVFGYGIETAMLNHVRRLGQGLNRSAIHGRIVETANNQPCRAVYADNGFARQGEVWVTSSGAGPADPAWLEVTGSNDIRQSLPI